MGVWSKIGKGALIGGAGLATYATGGMASPALGAAVKYATKKSPTIATGSGAGVAMNANGGQQMQPNGQPLLPGQKADPSSFEDAYKNYVLQGMNQSSGLADQVSRFSQQQHTMAAPAMQKAMQYYTNLASGSQSAIQSTLAPSMSQANQVYSGAERGLNSKMMAGGQRDNAMAELYRQKAGQLGMMPFMARNDAMGQLSNMGQQGVQNALQGYSVAGNMLSPAQYGASNIFQANAAKSAKWGQIGSAIGGVAANYFLNKYGGGG